MMIATSGDAIASEWSSPRLSWDEKRFGVQFRRALRVLERRGRITQQQLHHYWSASLDSRVVKDGQSFIQLLAQECRKTAGDLGDDIQRWLMLAYEWLVQNWDVVLKIIISILALI